MPKKLTSKSSDVEYYASVPLPMLREIVREAELFLEAQLKSGLAADSRAMTLGSVLATLISLLLGATATITVAKMPIWPYWLAVVALVLFLCIAMSHAIRAARPTSFDYAGSNPQAWISDIKKKRSLKRSLAGLVALYENNITSNDGVLAENHRCFYAALIYAGVGFVAATFILGLMILINQPW